MKRAPKVSASSDAASPAAAPAGTVSVPAPSWARDGGAGGGGGPHSRGAYLTMGAEQKASPLAGTPGWFCREILRIKPHGWQDKVLWDVAVGRRPVALCAANGSGKTQMVAAPLILWHCAVFPKSQVVTTAGVYRQVKEQLWTALRQSKERLGASWEINATDLHAPNGSRAVGFSTDDPGKFEGWHNDNLLMIVDEAKSVPDEIFQAIERCQPTRLLLMSSAGTSDGEFAAAFSTRRRFYSQHKVTAMDCPHLKDKWIAAQIEKWGRDHPLVRSMIFSEFSESNSGAQVITRTAVAKCLESPPEYVHGPTVAFIDWAAGGDENAIAIVKGNRLFKLICWRDKDTMQAAARAIAELHRWEVPAGGVFADDSGLGHPINDALAKAGVQVRRVMNNAKAWDEEHYMNLGAELWYTAARRIEHQEVSLLDDEVLLEQLTGRRQIVTPNGRLALERKEDMRSRGMSSPDRADAVLAAIAIAQLTRGGYFESDAMDDSDTVVTDDSVSQHALEHDGFYAGA